MNYAKHPIYGLGEADSNTSVYQQPISQMMYLDDKGNVITGDKWDLLTQEQKSSVAKHIYDGDFYVPGYNRNGALYLLDANNHKTTSQISLGPQFVPDSLIVNPLHPAIVDLPSTPQITEPVEAKSSFSLIWLAPLLAFL